MIVMFNWIAKALAASVPDFGGVEPYVVSESPSLISADSVGCFHPELSLLLRDGLRSHGLWRGIRPAFVISASNYYIDYLAVAVHEVGHFLVSPPSPVTDDILASAPPDCRKWAVSMFSSAAAAIAVDRPASCPWMLGGDHTLPFIRACCHVRHRLEMAGLFCSPAQILSPAYALSSFGSYYSALADECRERAGEPIRQILTTEPPLEVAAIWASDVVRFYGAK